MEIRKENKVASSKDLPKQETADEKEFRLHRSLVKEIKEVKVARIKGKNYCICKIENLVLQEPVVVSSMKDGNNVYSGRAEFHFVSSVQDDMISFGIMDFHGEVLVNNDSYSIIKPITIEREMGVMVNNLKLYVVEQ